jgi:predicted permease
MESFSKDFRFALRMLLKRPLFTAVTIVVLALGIGANTAIFSLTNHVLLRALPVQNPEQLVVLSSTGPKQGRVWADTEGGEESFSYPMYKDLRDNNDAFSGLLARFPVSLSIAFQGQTERAEGELVSGDYFDVLGVKAALGRTFTPNDDLTLGAHPVVMLSHNFWSRRLASDPAVVDQTIIVNGQAMTVVGVTQPGFEGVQVGQRPDVFVPISMKAQMTPNWDGLNDRKDYWLSILGRLKPGVDRKQAMARLEPLYRSLLESEAPLQRNLTGERLERFISKKLLLADGSGGRQVLQRDVATPLKVLMGMVGLVLLIACANVASLLIARGAARQKEIAIRQALGASRYQLVRQLLVESIILSLAGGIVGLLVSMWTISGLLHWMPSSQGLGTLSAGLDYSLLAFNFGLALLTGLIFGLMPALKTTRTDLATTLKDQGASVSMSSSHARFRKGLVVAEIALTLVLLLSAGLFARSLYNLRNLDVGIRTERLIAFSIAPELNGYKPDRTIAFFGNLEDALAGMAGVQSVSSAEIPLFAGSNSSSNITVEGYTPTEGEDMSPMRNGVGPAYFATMGVPLVGGREFTKQDSLQNQKVAIVSESFAKRFFGDASALGRRMAFGGGNNVKLDIEIVGVAKDAKHSSVRGENQPFIYTPYMQNEDIGQITFYVRTTQEPEALANSLRHQVAQLDPNLPVYSLRTLQEQIEESIFGDQLMAVLSAVFGLLAALLATVGIYGVMAWTVTQRSREIGIRMALGARAGDVLKLIVGQGMMLTIIGVVIGLAAAYGVTRLVESLLFSVSATDVPTFIVITLLLIAVSLVACYLPARRATKVDPIVALRHE